MDCIPEGPGQPYEDARRISNARFDYKPREICYCTSEAEVQATLKRGRRPLVRVRSGGHQHEGMCSGDGVLIVDVSKLDTIHVDGNGLVVGPGARLRDIYKALFAKRRLLPGGGCGDVCIGGLAQGGGWGLYSRALGLTCDRLVGFRIVKANGDVLNVTRQGDDLPLFWAIAGGGGGNFGVITEYRFALGVLDGPITGFTVSWSDPKLTAGVIEDWRNHFPFDADKRLTSFCRLTTAGGAASDQPVVIAGNFLGEESEAVSILQRLLPNTWSRKASVCLNRVDQTGEGEHVFQHPEYQPGPPMEALRVLPQHAESVRADLGSTCDGIPYPHKVSSCFPRDDFGAPALEKIDEYLRGSKAEPTARRYLSLHSLGGVVGEANPWSCFAFRDKPFLLQYQAWWADRNETEVGKRCMDWVKRFREAMQPYTEFSFINFPDRDLAADRKELMGYYYADRLQRLMEIKKQYDPGNLFDFPMGIPLP